MVDQKLQKIYEQFIIIIHFIKPTDSSTCWRISIHYIWTHRWLSLTSLVLVETKKVYNVLKSALEIKHWNENGETAAKHVLSV